MSTQRTSMPVREGDLRVIALEHPEDTSLVTQSYAIVATVGQKVSQLVVCSFKAHTGWGINPILKAEDYEAQFAVPCVVYTHLVREVATADLARVSHLIARVTPQTVLKIREMVSKTSNAIMALSAFQLKEQASATTASDFASARAHGAFDLYPTALVSERVAAEQANSLIAAEALAVKLHEVEAVVTKARSAVLLSAVQARLSDLKAVVQQWGDDFGGRIREALEELRPQQLMPNLTAAASGDALQIYTEDGLISVATINLGGFPIGTLHLNVRREEEGISVIAGLEIVGGTADYDIRLSLQDPDSQELWFGYFSGGVPTLVKFGEENGSGTPYLRREWIDKVADVSTGYRLQWKIHYEG